MADNTGVTSPYPYLRRVSTLPEVISASHINLADTLILVQADTTKKASIGILIDRILDLINAPDAYTLAIKHGVIPANWTIYQWFEYLRGGGVSSDELKVVVGKYQIIKGTMGVDINGKQVFTQDPNDGTVPDGESFVIYQDKSTGKCYTKQAESSAYHEWEGIMDAFTFISEIIGNKENVPTLKANMRTTDHFPSRQLNGVTVDDPYQVTTFAGLRVYENRDPVLGELVRFSYNDDPYGRMEFYDGVHFVEYNGIVDYIQTVTNNIFRITAGAAAKLANPRDISIETGLDHDNLTDITPGLFDGSEDAVITINQLNAEVLVGSGDFTAARSITAEKIKNPIDLKFTGAINQTVENIDMSRDITVNVSAVDASKLTGSLPSTITTSKLSTPRTIGIVSGKSGDTTTSITGKSFDGSQDINLVINKINAALIDGTVAEATSAISATSAGRATEADHATSANTANTAQNSYAAGQLANTIAIGITTVVSEDTITRVSPARTNGSASANIEIEKLNAALIQGDLGSDVWMTGGDVVGGNIRGSTIKGATINADTNIVVNNQSSGMYLVGVPVGGSDNTSMSQQYSGALYRTATRNSNGTGNTMAQIDTDGILTVSTVKNRRSSALASDGYYSRNIGYGTSATPNSNDVRNGDIWVYYE